MVCVEGAWKVGHKGGGMERTDGMENECGDGARVGTGSRPAGGGARTGKHTMRARTSAGTSCKTTLFTNTTHNQSSFGSEERPNLDGGLFVSDPDFEWAPESVCEQGIYHFLGSEPSVHLYGGESCRSA